MIWELDALKMLALNPIVPGAALQDVLDELERFHSAYDYAKKIMISAKSQPEAKESIQYNAESWFNRYGNLKP